MSSLTQTKTVILPSSNVSIFYREKGSLNAPVILLLHGFPSSSHQYRNLIPILATKYRVIAPDLPGFGFTETPLDYQHNFANLARTIGEFLDTLFISKFAVYIFDYGAPTALRLALQRPNAIRAIISQNGNAYEEGLGEAWAPLKSFWMTKNTKEDRTPIENALLTLGMTKWQYESGTKDVTTIAPESYHLDYALMERPGNKDIQLDLFYDYQNNVALYPRIQEYFRKSQVPLLAVWGKNDAFFIPPGAEAFKKDLPNAEVKLLDAGHFAVESDTEEIGQLILDFLGRNQF